MLGRYRYSLVAHWPVHAPTHPVVARLTADPLSSTPTSTTAAPGRPFVLSRRYVPRGLPTQEHDMTTTDTRRLSLLTPTGHLTLGNLLGALRPMAAEQDGPTASTASPTCTP